MYWVLSDTAKLTKLIRVFHTTLLGWVERFVLRPLLAKQTIHYPGLGFCQLPCGWEETGVSAHHLIAIHTTPKNIGHHWHLLKHFLLHLPTMLSDSQSMSTTLAIVSLSLTVCPSIASLLYPLCYYITVLYKSNTCSTLLLIKSTIISQQDVEGIQGPGTMFCYGSFASQREMNIFHNFWPHAQIVFKHDSKWL